MSISIFGSRNFTGVAFFGRIRKFSLEFSAGIVEELALNVTGSTAAHAAEVPQSINIKLISKDQFIASTSAVVGSKIAQTKLVDIIVGATSNLHYLK